MADVSTGTDKAELKAFLRRSSEEAPVKCAVAQPKDGPLALLMVHRSKLGKALSGEIEKGFPGAKNLRWGTAWPDTNRNEPPPGVTLEAMDDKLVVMMLNRPAPGLSKRLAKTLRINMTGFNKVELRFEDGSETERHSGEDDDDEAGAPTATGAVNYAKSRLAWLAARKKVDSEVDKLRAEMLAYFAEDDIAPQITDAYAKRVRPVLDELDEALADKLDDAANTADPARRATLVAAARTEIDRYTAFVAADPTIKALDTNPFVPLAIKQTMEATLTALHAAVR